MVAFNLLVSLMRSLFGRNSNREILLLYLMRGMYFVPGVASVYDVGPSNHPVCES